MVARVTSPATQPLAGLPAWVRLVRAPNAGPMTLDGTNTWVLAPAGAGASVVVDPGPLDEAHLAAVAEHGPVAAILTTHGHPDHVEGLDRFREMVGDAESVDRTEGATLTGPGGVRITVLATPGHTADSVCFLAEYGDERVIFTGDTILGRGTTVVAYPDGDLGDYLASLRRLAELTGVPVLPGHGPALDDCAAAAGFYLEHRLARLEQVRAIRASGVTAPGEIVAQAYADVERSLWPAAERSVRAQLAYLDRESGGEPPAGGLP
ncbi:MAG TPA: MBL fold metallo-hydrolase [Micromonosporaceae bacterium]|nr:MBL fold metallo-hydrolase [Micromonosporaceae bacterium]